MILIETILWLRVREDSVQIFLETNCFFSIELRPIGGRMRGERKYEKYDRRIWKVFIVLEKQVYNTKAKNWREWWTSWLKKFV